MEKFIILFLVMTMFVVSGSVLHVDLDVSHPGYIKSGGWITNESDTVIRVVVVHSKSREVVRVIPRMYPGDRISIFLREGTYSVNTTGYYDNRNFGERSFRIERYDRDWRLRILGPWRITFDRF